MTASHPGSPRTHARRRQLLRQRLRAEGVPEQTIAQAVDRLRKRQDAARRANVNPRDLDAHVDAWWEQNRPDDKGYKPTTPDPLLRGAARATGATARALKRTRATTRYEHNQQETRD